MLHSGHWTDGTQTFWSDNGMSSIYSMAGVLLLVSVAVPIAASAKPYTSLYVLGDSYSDQGNLLAATTASGPALGQPQQPDPARYDNGRFSNGPIYLDVLAHGLGVASTPSLLGGTNFAFGGALTATNTNEQPPAGTGAYPPGIYLWSLNAERDAFSARVAAEGADPTGLYVVFSGLNDIAAVAQRGLPPGPTIASTVTGVINAVEAFKAAGAQTVLVPNLPDIGLLPVVTSLEPLVPGVSAQVSQLTAGYNAALAAALAQVSGIQVIQFDTFKLLDDVVANPTQFGFSNATTPCYSGFVVPDPTATVCSDPSQHVFWDPQHPTTAFQTLLGEQLLATVMPVPEPSTAGLLGETMAALALLRSWHKGRRRWV